MNKNFDREKAKEMLENGVKNIWSSKEWKNYLLLSRNLSGYSHHNKILVFCQNPNATFVKGSRGWQDLGRTVNKGAKPIYICRHVSKEIVLSADELKKKAKENPYYERFLQDTGLERYEINTAYYDYYPVYDISDTSGKDIPHDIRSRLTEGYADYASVAAGLKNIAADAHLTVSFSNPKEDMSLRNAYGYFRPSTGSIVLRDNMGEQETLQTLVHELAHGLMHGSEMLVEGIETTSSISHSEKEIQAESVAYVVCQSLGIDSGCDSFGYIAEYAGEKPKKLLAQMSAIDKCAETIIRSLEKTLEKSVEMER